MLESIQYWTNGIIENQLNSPLFFMAVFLLGLIAAIGSCCNIGVVAAITGYAGSNQKNEKMNSHLKTGFSFFLGNIISLSILGLLTGIVSQSTSAALGKYWTIIAGLFIVYLGLVSLDMLPFEFKLKDKLNAKILALTNKGFIFGLALGGFATACSACCNPILPIVLGTSFLQGSIFLSWFTLLIFAIGYSLPLGGVLAGAGFGFDKFSEKIIKNKKVLNEIFGIILILVGFGLLLNWI